MPKPRVTISTRQLSPAAPQAGEYDLLDAAGSAAPGRGRATRVEQIPLSRVFPDEYQARTLLPPQIAAAFFRFGIDWAQAAQDWLALARSDLAVGRRVNSLLSLGFSLNNDGQVKTATGSWQNVAGHTVFLLETGERRFWGLALNAVLEVSQTEPLLEAITISEPNRIRQVVENEKYETPNAVSRARAVAGLIMHYYDTPPQRGMEGRNEYHRSALGKRLTRVTWADIERIIGIGRPALVRHLQILELPDALLELADLYNVPERILREVRQLPQKQWQPALLAAIEQGLTSEEIPSFEPDAAPRTPGSLHTPRPVDPAVRAASRLKAVIVGIGQPGGVDPDALADALCMALKTGSKIQRAADALESLARQLRLRV